MRLFQEKAAALKQLSFCWGFRSMRRRRRPPPLLCGSTPQIFSRASSMITHRIINREFDRIGCCCGIPRYGFYFSSDAASRAQMVSSSSDEQKPTADVFLSSREVHLFQLVRHHLVNLLSNLCDKVTFWHIKQDPVRAAAACEAIVRVLCSSPGVKKKSMPQFSEIRSSDKDSGFDVLAMHGFLSERKNSGVYREIRRTFESVIKAYVKLKMPDRAAHTFFLACARGYDPGTDTCDVLIDLLVGWGYMEWVEDVYIQMKRPKVLVTPDLDYCHRAMEYSWRDGKFSEAFGFLNEMIQEGTVPDPSILSDLVRGLCDHKSHDSDGYLVLIKSVSILGISMTTVSYNLVISGFCETGKLCEAELVLEDMVVVKQGVPPPDVKTYASLIVGYCCSSVGEKKNISRVLSLLHQMDTRGIKPNSAIKRSVLPCLSELGKNDDDQVLEFCKRYKNSGEIGELLDRVLYNIAIDARCKLGKMEEAVQVFQEMKGCGLVPDKIHYDTLINGYCRRCEISGTTDVGVKTDDVETCNVLASAFAESGFVEETLGLFYHMLDHGVEPNSVTHANVIEGFCRGLSKLKLSHV